MEWRCSDRDTVLDAVKKTPNLLEIADLKFRDDYEVVMAAVRSGKYAAEGFNVASFRLRGDRAIVMACVANDKYEESPPFIDPALFEDRAFVLDLIESRDYIFKWTPLNGDRDFVFDALVRNVSVMDHVDETFTDDKEFMLALIRSEGGARFNYLMGASQRLRGDREVVMAGIRRAPGGGAALGHVEMPLRCEVEVVMEAARTDGFVLENVALYIDMQEETRRDLLANRDVVLAAVGNYGPALKWAAAHLRADRHVIMAALSSTYGYAPMDDVPMPLREDPVLQLCASCEIYEVAEIDLLLASVERATHMHLKTLKGHKSEYNYLTSKPFTPRNVLPYLVGVTTVSGAVPDRLQRVADRMNASSWMRMQSVSRRMQYYTHGEATVTMEHVEDAVIGSRDLESASDVLRIDKLHTTGVLETVTASIRRLKEIEDALPHVAASFDNVHSSCCDAKHVHSKRLRTGWAERVEALARSIHDPQGAFARYVHKRDFEAAFE